MRFKCSEDPNPNILIKDSLIIVYNANDIFRPADYLWQGFTKFDVICIGAAGSSGVAISRVWNSSTYWQFAGGGGGGGGGFHRVQGNLSSLSSIVAVVVGVQGTPNDYDGGYITNYPYYYLGPTISDGSDGGSSSFGATVCRASGGKGGTHAVNTFAATTPSITGLTAGSGGQGGIGNSITAGGGAAGGTPASINGVDGTLNGIIGSGGGGGCGSRSYRADPASEVTSHNAGSGGKGSFLVFDPTISDSKQNVPHGSTVPQLFNYSAFERTCMGGMGGGAKALALNNLNRIFGNSNNGVYTPGGLGYSYEQAADGVVVLKLT